jgi:DNA-binding FadR family transcriptional regulator
MLQDRVASILLRYLVDHRIQPGSRVPPLSELSQELGVSVGKLREELEVARHLGIVSVRPRLGIRREPLDLHQALQAAMIFGLVTGELTFEHIRSLRITVESATWNEAVRRLTDDDKARLRVTVADAWRKLKGDPVHIPNAEHREFHLAIYRRLDNPFVQALLLGYWDAYEAVELTRFVDLGYWHKVWTFHERIVEAICAEEYEAGKALLIEHFGLLRSVTPSGSSNNGRSARTRLYLQPE